MKYVYESTVRLLDGYHEVEIPDFGLITQGLDEEDAAYMAQDMLGNAIVVYLQEGKALPVPTFGHPCPEDGYKMVVSVMCDENTPQEETMTVAEAADVLGVSESRVRAMIGSGILKSKKIGKVHMADAESVIERFNRKVAMSKCPLCGSQVVTVPYKKIVLFGEVPIKYDSTVEHCTNPDCAEPNWFTCDQLLEQKRQRHEQLNIKR